jgi:hypothetical protein
MTKRVILLAALLASCGKEVGRIAMTGEGEGDATVTLKAGEPLALWTALDVTWDGAWMPTYEVELRDSSGKAVGTTKCDPLDPSTRMSSVITNVGSHHTRSYAGKMKCELQATSAGTYTVHAKLGYGPTKPTSLSVKDISLVLKT